MYILSVRCDDIIAFDLSLTDPWRIMQAVLYKFNFCWKNVPLLEELAFENDRLVLPQDSGRPAFYHRTLPFKCRTLYVLPNVVMLPGEWPASLLRIFYEYQELCQEIRFLRFLLNKTALIFFFIYSERQYRVCAILNTKRYLCNSKKNESNVWVTVSGSSQGTTKPHTICCSLSSLARRQI